MSKYWLGGLIILINSIAVSVQARQIVVVGLFEGHAVIQLDGEQRMLYVGKTTVEGIKLIAADSQTAVIEIDGKRQTYQLGSQVSTDFGPAPQHAKVSIWPQDGMYFTNGRINGYSVRFLVDTGATAVSLNADTAKQVGIDFQQGRSVVTQTASGPANGYLVKLDNVQVGEIKLYNIDAVVSEDAYPPFVLLGMSFLSQLEIHHSGERMDLKQKY